MKVLVAGATGVIGRRLLPLLVQAGHEVFGTTRSQASFDTIRAAGAKPIALDAVDAGAVMDAVRAASPEVVIHQLTAIPKNLDLRKLDQEFEPTNRLRTEGTDHLLAAARACGAMRFIAQSYAGWPYQPTGGMVKTEDDPLNPNPPEAMRRTLDAIRHVEDSVSREKSLTGIVLRYGGFYGPGSSLAADGAVADLLRAGKFPIVGKGTAVWSFIHLDDAATATVLAIDRARAGIYNIVDDEPAAINDWVPYLAECVGAKPPPKIPAFVGRMLAGDAAMFMMNEARGASNRKAKSELGWEVVWKSWREGFRCGLGAAI